MITGCGHNSVLYIALNLGFLRRKEKVVCPVKNGFPIEKKLASYKKPPYRKFWSAYSFLGRRYL